MPHPPLYAFNDCYSELTRYTMLSYSYWVRFHAKGMPINNNDYNYYITAVELV